MLVTADEQCAKETANAIMGWMDMDVETAESGRIACIMATIALAEERPYHAVFIDMQMPKGDGAETAEWLQQHSLQGSVIGIGANVSDEDRKRFLAAGCDDFIDKPLTDEKVRSALSRFVKSKSDETAPAIPVEKKTVSDEPGHVVSSQDQTPPISPKTAKPHARVLVVEDALCMQAIVGAFLQRMNFEVDMANDGQTACEMAMQSLAKGRPYDVILMDIWMPKMDGKRATKWLREHEWKGPIIAVSSHNTPKDHTAFTNAGCNGFLAKPLTNNQLRDVLSQYLQCE